MIDISNVEFQYSKSSESDFMLKIDQLKIAEGSRIAIVGPSGSGKTTLLNLISGIDVPDQGKIIVGGHSIDVMSESKRRLFRVTEIGMVFQRFELVEYLDAFNNILLPFYISSRINKVENRFESARQLAEQMGLSGKLRRYPHQLSQGEQQRVAICRALITEPSVILADEPTGNLDPKNKKAILDLLFDTCSKNHQTLLVVTHDVNILDGFDQIVDFEEFTSHAELD
ncbi:MAG: ABC transporter ATP-binding protein [Planctomycetota bacterium]